MTRIRNLYLVIFFCLFIFSAAAGIILLPKSDVSLLEKRSLSTAPEFSIENILNGKFEKQTETYTSDHFPFRAIWVSLDSYTRLYTGRNGTDGIYKGSDGYLINAPVSADYDKLDKNLDAMISFSENSDIPSSMMIVPTAGYILDDKLPKNHLEYHDKELISYAYKKSEKFIGIIDLIEPFLNQKNDSQLYYKTDHHWTTAGAYAAYLEYCKNIGFDEPLWDFNILRYKDFFGTAYSKSALWLEQGDVLEVWEYPIDVNVNIEDETISDSLYFYEYLNKLDKYPIFLDGNHGIEKIVNNSNPNGEKLLVIKDSFAHCLVPFLINHYSEIDMVDTRYYLDPVSNLTQENSYDRILYVFGLSSLCESSDISILQ